MCVKDSLARQVSDMDKGVVEGGEDVAHSEYVLSFSHLWSQADNLLLLLFLPFTRSHCLRRQEVVKQLYASPPSLYTHTPSHGSAQHPRILHSEVQSERYL